MKYLKPFKKFIHFLFISEFIYAFVNFITSQRNTEMLARRLWEYECWITLTFYFIFLWLFAYTERFEVDEIKQNFLFRNKNIFAAFGITFLLCTIVLLAIVNP
jgi:hypothetical protein